MLISKNNNNDEKNDKKILITPVLVSRTAPSIG